MAEVINRIPGREYSLSIARDRVVKEFASQERKAVTYDLAFDVATYKALTQLKAQPDLYESKKEELNGYTQMQLKTTLSERFNVLSSTVRYNIHEGRLYGENTDEPFMDMLVRGRDYRRIHGKPIDHPREQAEVDGFSQIEAVMTDKNTPTGTMMLSISPQGGEGSVYKHNFYDIYTIKGEEEDRFVEFKRFSAGLSREEFAVKASELDMEYSAFSVPSDAEFLAQPIRVDPRKGPFKDAENLHEYFHTHHEYMSEEQFNREILSYCAPLILSYNSTLCEDPTNQERLALVFNALLNKADQRADYIKHRGTLSLKNVETDIYLSPKSLEAEIEYLGRKAVRMVDTGCGELGGVPTSQFGATMGGAGAIGPMGVAFFGGGEVKKTWAYTYGDCIVCKDGFVLVGPCKICKTCEKKFD